MGLYGENMGGTVTGVLVLVSVLFVVAWIGHKQKKKAEADLIKITREVLSQNPDTEMLGPISYHGGFPQMPKPSILQLAITDDSLLLYDYKGCSGKVYFREKREVDRFTVLMKADTVGKHTMLGPLVPFFFKDKLRHFIAIKYIDGDREENHLLLEAGNKAAQQKIYEKLLAK